MGIRSYYRVCSLCEASLDPGEQCDCMDIAGSSAGTTSLPQEPGHDRTQSKTPKGSGQTPRYYMQASRGCTA